MQDDELVHAFEAATLAGDAFPHAAHVRVAWYYLNRYPLLVAMTRFRRMLQRFATAKGKPTLYHETITVAYLLLIAERLGPLRGSLWTEFASRNADLLTWKPSILERYYTAETLWSDDARQTFVMPDRTEATGEGLASALG
jgi:hypothetical protein